MRSRYTFNHIIKFIFILFWVKLILSIKDFKQSKDSSTSSATCPAKPTTKTLYRLGHQPMSLAQINAYSEIYLQTRNERKAKIQQLFHHKSIKTKLLIMQTVVNKENEYLVNTVKNTYKLQSASIHYSLSGLIKNITDSKTQNQITEQLTIINKALENEEKAETNAYLELSLETKQNHLKIINNTIEILQQHKSFCNKYISHNLSNYTNHLQAHIDMLKLKVNEKKSFVNLQTYFTQQITNSNIKKIIKTIHNLENIITEYNETSKKYNLPKTIGNMYMQYDLLGIYAKWISYLTKAYDKKQKIEFLEIIIKYSDKQLNVLLPFISPLEDIPFDIEKIVKDSIVSRELMIKHLEKNNQIALATPNKKEYIHHINKLLTEPIYAAKIPKTARDLSKQYYAEFDPWNKIFSSTEFFAASILLPILSCYCIRKLCYKKKRPTKKTKSQIIKFTHTALYNSMRFPDRINKKKKNITNKQKYSNSKINNNTTSFLKRLSPKSKTKEKTAEEIQAEKHRDNAGKLCILMKNTINNRSVKLTWQINNNNAVFTFIYHNITINDVNNIKDLLALLLQKISNENYIWSNTAEYHHKRNHSYITLKIQNHSNIATLLSKKTDKNNSQNTLPNI